MSRRSTLDPAEGLGFRIDAVSFLAVYCVLLFALPAQLVLPGMGAIGTPATAVGLLGFAWWLVATLVPGEKEFRSRNPVRVMLAVYLAVVLVCWAIGRMQPLTPLGATTSDRAIMAMIGLAGVALVAMDGLRSMSEVGRVVGWAIGCSMVMAGVGLVQFFFGYDLARHIRIPGLEYNRQILEIDVRSIFNRPRGTALHPIEFGVVSAALLPLAYWRACGLRTKRAFIPIAVLFLSAMVSLSRSAVLVFAVAAVVMLVGSSWKQRLSLVASAVGAIVAAGVLVNGLVGTLKTLFTGTDSDPSVQARLDRFPAVVELVAEHPWLGRGFGTYTIEQYFLLDNEIQKTAIESGLIGVAVLLLFVLFIVRVAWRTRGTEDLSRIPGTALAATILGIFISTYTFDAFYYRIVTGTLYLCIGLVGATWRIRASERIERAVPDQSRPESIIELPTPRPAVFA